MCLCAIVSVCVCVFVCVLVLSYVCVVAGLYNRQEVVTSLMSQLVHKPTPEPNDSQATLFSQPGSDHDMGSASASGVATVGRDSGDGQESDTEFEGLPLDNIPVFYTGVIHELGLLADRALLLQNVPGHHTEVKISNVWLHPNVACRCNK